MAWSGLNTDSISLIAAEPTSIWPGLACSHQHYRDPPLQKTRGMTVNTAATLIDDQLGWIRMANRLSRRLSGSALFLDRLRDKMYTTSIHRNSSDNYVAHTAKRDTIRLGKGG